MNTSLLSLHTLVRYKVRALYRLAYWVGVATVSVFCALLVLFLMGVGPMMPWGATQSATFRRQLIVPGAVGLLTALGCYLWGLRGGLDLTTFGLAAFVTVVTVRELIMPARQRMSEQKEGAFAALFRRCCIRSAFTRQGGRSCLLSCSWRCCSSPLRRPSNPRASEVHRCPAV